MVRDGTRKKSIQCQERIPRQYKCHYQYVYCVLSLISLTQLLSSESEVETSRWNETWHIAVSAPTGLTCDILFSLRGAIVIADVKSQTTKSRHLACRQSLHVRLRTIGQRSEAGGLRHWAQVPMSAVEYNNIISQWFLTGRIYPRGKFRCQGEFILCTEYEC